MLAITKKNSLFAAKNENNRRLLAFISLNLIVWLTIATNLLLVIFLSFISGDILWEFFKLIQSFAFLALLFFCFSKFFNKIITFLIAIIFYFFYLILVSYYFITHNQLDFNFFLKNISNIKPILFYFWPWIVIIIVLSSMTIISFYWGVKKIKLWDKIKITIFIISVFFLLIGYLSPFKSKANNEFIYFTKSIFISSPVIGAYQKYYQKLIQSNIAIKSNLLEKSENFRSQQQNSYLDNIIILQIESLNGLLVNKKNTPEFLSLAKKGVLFSNFYGNSVQTILGQENILCSLPTSFDFNLVTTNKDKNIICLPNIFRNLGYQTFFLKTYDLSFTHTGDFMRHIGFNEVHADDIMLPDDPKYIWGYREDVFYRRAFKFIKKHKKTKNFIYLEIGPTHHWPFSIPSDYHGPVPYPQPTNFKERFANTLFIQDQYLKIAWQEINRLWPEKNYTVLILGDHSWPVGFHPGNTFNEKGAYEENFRTALVMIFGNEKKFQNLVIKEKFSQMDIMPSLLDLMGITLPPSNIRRSFMPTIISTDAPIADHLIILVQPYEQRYLSIIRGDNKFLYNAALNQFIKYNLKTDPNEQKGEIIGRRSEQNLKIFNSLLNSN